jgi:hypothetical protein
VSHPAAPPLKWRKLGKIFDPARFELPDHCEQFAQAPQALAFDNFTRIYFSSRERDPRNGKYLSHVCFADFTKDFRQVIRVSDRSVIELGKLGCFDEHGIFPMNVLRHGGKIYGYTCGWSRRTSVSVETSVGMARSDDEGLTFRRIGDGPILTSSLHEPFLVGDAFVRLHGDQFHMWYIFGTAWKRPAEGAAPERTYKIGHAVSRDGFAWEKEEARQIVADRLGTEESQALPTVARIGDRYHMIFCYRQSIDFRANKERGYRLGHAWSQDLSQWTRDDAGVGIDVSVSGWDSDMLCYPDLFECEGHTYLLYNGNEFGRHGFGIAILE